MEFGRPKLSVYNKKEDGRILLNIKTGIGNQQKRIASLPIEIWMLCMILLLILWSVLQTAFYYARSIVYLLDSTFQFRRCPHVFSFQTGDGRCVLLMQ
jgi:hypothetical protein